MNAMPRGRIGDRIMDKLNAVELEKIWVRYGDQTVLEDITLTVEEGEIVSIVGPNGGGKTTLLLTIVGLIKPSSGIVRVLGKEPSENRKNGIIGFLPQNMEYDRFFPVSAFDVVAMSRFAQKPAGGRLEAKDRDRILLALERVGMQDIEKHHFGSLSGGQKQRVLIARALVGEPRLLILDEPSTGLDAVAQDVFYQILRSIRDEEKITILLVSHDIGTVSSVVDRLACLNKRIHFHGKPRECIPTEALEKVFGRHIQFVLHDEHCQTCEHRP